MRRYACFALPLLLALVLIPTSLGAPPSCESSRLYCSARTDKPYYSPGDTGKLTIDLKNLYNYPIQVNNLTVTFPWSAYINGQWDGNSTISLPTANITNGNWMPEQSVSFNVPTDGRFTASIFGSSIGIEIHYTAYCTGCAPGEYRTASLFGVSIIPNAFLISTGWQATSSYILYADILLGALVVLFVIYIFRSRQRSPAIPR